MLDAAVFVQVQVTVPPAAMVSTARFTDQLCPLVNTLLPTLTEAVGGAVPPPVFGAAAAGDTESDRGDEQVAVLHRNSF